MRVAQILDNELKTDSINLVLPEFPRFETTFFRFLFEAIEFLKRNDGLTVEGIFRRQGNTARVDNAEVSGRYSGPKPHLHVQVAFSGLVPIPEECTCFDVGVLIKRFFKRIDGGIFGDKEHSIIEFAMDSDGMPIKRPLGLFTILKTLPTANLATLAFLMNFLRRVSLLTD